MAKLYEIDEAIMNCVDAETGEIVDPDQLEKLQIERTKKIEGVVCWYKNLVSDAEAYKKEKDAFAEREKAAKNKAESLKNWIGYALNGERFTTEKVDVRFTRSTGIEFDDEGRFIECCVKAGRDDLLTYKEPTPNKKAIKEELKLCPSYYGAYMADRLNAQIK